MQYSEVGEYMVKEIIEQDVIKIQNLIKEILQHNSFSNIERLGGLTNHTYKIVLKDEEEYVIRIPGEGTEEIIVRKDEKVSTELAHRLGIDAELLYFGVDGTKITKYIPEATTMSSFLLRKDKHVKQVAHIFQKLHNSNVDTKISFKFFEIAEGYEEIILKNNVQMFNDYKDVKNVVMNIKEEVDNVCKVRIVSCHNDPLCENWILDGNGKMYLIDWEYAGMNDFMWDLADVSLEASYDEHLDKLLLNEYFKSEPTLLEWKHLLANKIYVDFLWSLWAKMRVPYDGQPMENWAIERYNRMKNNIKEYEKIGI